MDKDQHLERLFEKAKKALSMGDVWKAERYVERAQTLAPTDPSVKANMNLLAGKIRFEMKRYDDALYYFFSALKDHYNDPQIVSSTVPKILRSLYLLGNYKRVLSDVDNFSKLYHMSNNVLLIKGKALFQLKRYQEALDLFDSIIQNDPKEELALLFRSALLNDAKHLDDEILQLSRIRVAESTTQSKSSKIGQLNPYYYELSLYKEGTNLYNNNTSQEFQDFVEGLLIALDFRKIVLEIVKFNEKAKLFKDYKKFFMKGEIHQKIIFLKKLLRNVPDCKIIWEMLGLYYREQILPHLSLICAQKISLIDPIDNSALNRQGGNHAFMGELTEAIQCFEQSIELSPDNMPIKVLGDLYELIGNKEKANYYLDKYLKSNPEEMEEILERINSINNDSSSIFGITKGMSKLDYIEWTNSHVSYSSQL